MAGDLMADKYDAPAAWLVVFSRSLEHLHNRIVPGWFKHVNCIGWLPRTRSWVFYDVGALQTSIFVAPEGAQANAIIELWCAGATVLEMKPREGSRPLWMRPFGFWCTTAVAHVIGSRSGAVLPDTFFRHCLRDGGEIVQDARRQAEAGPDATGTAGEAAERGPSGDPEANHG